MFIEFTSPERKSSIGAKCLSDGKPQQYRAPSELRKTFVGPLNYKHSVPPGLKPQQLLLRRVIAFDTLDNSKLIVHLAPRALSSYRS